MGKQSLPKLCTLALFMLMACDPSLLQNKGEGATKDGDSARAGHQAGGEGAESGGGNWWSRFKNFFNRDTTKLTQDPSVSKSNSQLYKTLMGESDSMLSKIGYRTWVPGNYQKIAAEIRKFPSLLSDKGPNPYGQLCSNYLTMSYAQKVIVTAKLMTVHAMTESDLFDKATDGTYAMGKNKKGKQTYWKDSDPPHGYWQNSTKSWQHPGITQCPKDVAGLRDVSSGARCVLDFYAFRVANGRPIYGNTDDTFMVPNYSKPVHGLAYSVLQDQTNPHSKKNTFRVKFVPLARHFLPECKNEFPDTGIVDASVASYLKLQQLPGLVGGPETAVSRPGI